MASWSLSKDSHGSEIRLVCRGWCVEVGAPRRGGDVEKLGVTHCVYRKSREWEDTHDENALYICLLGEA